MELRWDEKGEVVYASGDPYYLTCIRSSCKPFQASAAVKSGAVDAAGFSEDEIALMCASHNGEEIHVKQPNPCWINWDLLKMIFPVGPIHLMTSRPTMG
jgi:L-asparaginase II